MSDLKDTNPKDAVGTRKVPFSTLPFRVLHRVGLAMLEGALKYGRHNYRAAGVRASVYFDAVVARHLSSWWEGEDIDTCSGLHHIDKAIAGLMVLRDSMLLGNWIDDRPPSTVNEMAELNAAASALIDKYADKPKVRHYTHERASEPKKSHPFAPLKWPAVDPEQALKIRLRAVEEDKALADAGIVLRKQHEKFSRDASRWNARRYDDPLLFDGA